MVNDIVLVLLPQNRRNYEKQQPYFQEVIFNKAFRLSFIGVGYSCLTMHLSCSVMNMHPNEFYQASKNLG